MGRAFSIAFDGRPVAISARRFDDDGRMHVAMTPISKTGVFGYLGDEVPGGAGLGLDPATVYQFYRPASELRKAAPSVYGVPLLGEHQAMAAEDFEPAQVIGAALGDATYQGPYLRASLVVWDGDSIKEIEAGTKVELSGGYKFTPVMRGGVFEGQVYDGVQTGLVFNHIALVERGRNGSDVRVMDRVPRWLVEERRRYAAA